MKKQFIFLSVLMLLSFLAWTACNQGSTTNDQSLNDSTLAANSYDGFESQIAWGKHLVITGGCNDCHTPKKMTPMGPVPDTSLLLSGHPANRPAPDVNRMEMESKGLAVTNDLTVWEGPWGISYAANLTPDQTGIGNWTEAQFARALREGKYMGLENSRPLLPPMPWQEIGQMTDPEIAAVFAYLKSIKPVHNIVPAPIPPVTAPGKH